MLKYEERNVNPKNKKTCDCVVRAITSASNKPYNDVLNDLVKTMTKTGYMIDEKRCYEKVLESYGFTKMKQPRKEDNTKYLVRELDKLVNSDNYDVVVSMTGHLTCVKHNTIIDIWNCGSKTISNYFIRRREQSI